MPIPWDIAAGAFGITSAIVLSGGFILLRYQRDRYQFQLLHAALDKGITTLPGSVPAWLLSLRQGVLTVVLGLGLIGGGAALHAAAAQISEIPAAATQNALQPPQEDRAFRPPPPPRADDGPPDQHPPGEGNHPPPPGMERWHRVQTQQLTGLIAICSGVILVLLGLVRILFARSERKYIS